MEIEKLIEIKKTLNMLIDFNFIEIIEDKIQTSLNYVEEAITVTHCCKSDSELLCDCCGKPFKKDICDECADEIAEMQGI